MEMNYRRFYVMLWTTALVAVATLFYACSTSYNGSDQVSVQRGKEVYHEACAPCHGDNGDGNGPVSVSLSTKPRDFNRGVFKFRSTASGELPTDYDLLRIINSGIYHTAMPSFQQMSIADQYSVVEYIKTLSPLFSDSSQYPLDTVKVTAPVPYTYTSIEAGRKVYLDMHCWSCHGITGEGNGPAASSVTDDEGNHIQPTNLTRAWDMKVGRTPEKIYLIFSAGINGTPMPSYSQILTDRQRWDLANYVYSLSHRDRFYDGKQISDMK
jgi:mono/diheme cytochrome c family protein